MFWNSGAPSAGRFRTYCAVLLDGVAPSSLHVLLYFRSVIPSLDTCSRHSRYAVVEWCVDCPHLAEHADLAVVLGSNLRQRMVGCSIFAHRVRMERMRAQANEGVSYPEHVKQECSDSQVCFPITSLTRVRIFSLGVVSRINKINLEQHLKRKTTHTLDLRL